MGEDEGERMRGQDEVENRQYTGRWTEGDGWQMDDMNRRTMDNVTEDGRLAKQVWKQMHGNGQNRDVVMDNRE